MDDLDVRLRAAYRSLTEPSDLEASERAIAVAIRAADRRPRRATVGRLAVAAAALLVVVVAGGTGVIMGGPVPTTERSAAPAVSRSDPPAVSRSVAPTAAGSPVAAAPPRPSWYRQPLEGPAAGPGTMFAVASGGPGLVAVGSDRDTSHHHNTPTSERHHVEAVAWTSLDGGVWWRVAGQPGFEHAAMQDVAWSRDVLVAVGYDDSDPDGTVTTRLWSSRDGATWTALPDTTIPVDTRLTRVLGTPAGFLASGVERVADGIGRGVVWRSDDGVAWARSTDPAAFESGRLDAIFEVGGDLVAIGQKRGDYLRINPPVLWRSGDGLRWDLIPLADDAFGRDLAGLAAIARGGPDYIAVGTVIDTLSPQDPTSTQIWPPTDGAIWTSPDLRTWTRVEPARELFGGEDNQAINSVVAIRGGYIALGRAGSAAGAWSSADGQQWEQITLPEAATGTVDDAVVMNGAIIGVGGTDRAPAVWRGVDAADSASSPAAAAGVEYPISIYTHCGLDRSRIDFDGSFWDPVGETSDGQGNPPDGYDNPYDSGTIRLLPDGTSEFTSSQGVRLRLERVTAARSFEPCR